MKLILISRDSFCGGSDADVKNVMEKNRVGSLDAPEANVTLTHKGAMAARRSLAIKSARATHWKQRHWLGIDQIAIY